MELNGQLGIPYRLFILFALFFYYSFCYPRCFSGTHERTSIHVVTHRPSHILSVVAKETVVGWVICIALFFPLGTKSWHHRSMFNWNKNWGTTQDYLNISNKMKLYKNVHFTWFAFVLKNENKFCWKKMPTSPFAWRCLDSSFLKCHWVSHSRELIKRELKSPVFKNSHTKQNSIIKKVREWSGCDKILRFFGCLLGQIVQQLEITSTSIKLWALVFWPCLL